MYKKAGENNKSKEIIIAIVIIFLSVVGYVRSSSEPVLSENNKIHRSDYSQDEKNISFTASIDGLGSHDYELVISEREYTDEQCEKMYDRVKDEIGQIVLNQNESFDFVTGDLLFPEYIEGYPFDIEWKLYDRESFDSMGKLIAEEDGKTSLTCHISYKDWERDIVYEISYFPLSELSPDKLFGQLERRILESENDSRNDEFVVLPQNVDGYEITYSDSGGKRNPIILFLGVAALGALFLASKRDEEKEKKERRDSIENEYGLVLQKLVMYLSTGISLRNAWMKIKEDAALIGRVNPIYEEIEIMINEINTGVSESKAYSNFAERTGIPAITRMTALLSQNLKKGSTNLALLLTQEAQTEFEGRKRRARIKGEEAGTKLLGPMTMIMIVVMVIIMIPAFWSM